MEDLRLFFFFFLLQNTDYRDITGLRAEAQEKLNRIRPENVGQASRISGVSPADVSVLLIWLAKEAGEPLHPSQNMGKDSE